MERGKVVGAVRLSEFNPNFALPICILENKPGFWAQIVDVSGRLVDRFVKVDPEDHEGFNKLASIHIQTGSDYVHAFIDRKGGLHLGNSKELIVHFNIALGHPTTPTAVKLAIAECMASGERVKRLRRNLVLKIEGNFGNRAAISFLNSAATGQLWSLLESIAIDASALQRIRHVRSRTLAYITSSNKFRIDLSAIRPSDLRIDIAEIEARLNEQFAEGRKSGMPPTADLTRLPFSEDPTTVTILSAISRSSRQEERLAILLRSALLYPIIFREAIEHYSDPAKMARNAIVFLKGQYPQLSSMRSELARERFISKLLPPLFSAAFPRRRGLMLYYFATHLGDHHLLAEAVRALSAKSKSQDMIAMRPAIMSALENSKPKWSTS